MSRFEQFGAMGAPQPGQKGYKPRPDFAYPVADVAAALVDRALRTLEDPDTYNGWYSTWMLHHGEAPDGWTPTWESSEWEEAREYSDDWLDLLLALPASWPDGTALSGEERQALGLFVSSLALRTLRGTVGHPETQHRAERAQDEYGQLPVWAAEAILTDALQGKQPLRLVNVSKADAAAFIAQHHSALPYLNPKGLMYALGAMYGDRLVAVATAGTPTGNWARAQETGKRGVSPHDIIELTRVASDGTVKGAASKLAARILDLAPQSTRGAPGAPWLFVTYQLASEDGTTYKALREKGLRQVAQVPGKKTTTGQRATADDTALAAADKIRWEAGPAAIPSPGWEYGKPGHASSWVKAIEREGQPTVFLSVSPLTFEQAVQSVRTGRDVPVAWRWSASFWRGKQKKRLGIGDATYPEEGMRLAEEAAANAPEEKPPMYPIDYFNQILARAPAPLRAWMRRNQVQLVEAMTSELIPRTGAQLDAWLNPEYNPKLWDAWLGQKSGTTERLRKTQGKKLPVKYIAALQARAYAPTPVRGKDHEWYTGYWWWPDLIRNEARPVTEGQVLVATAAMGDNEPRRTSREHRQAQGGKSRGKSALTGQHVPDSATAWVRDLKGNESQWAQRFLDILRDGKPRTFNRLILEATDGKYSSSEGSAKSPEFALWRLVGAGFVEHTHQGLPWHFRLKGSTLEPDAVQWPAPSWPEDLGDDFVVAIPRAAVGASPQSAWQEAANRTGATPEDVHRDKHDATHWRWVIVPKSKPPPSPTYREAVIQQYIAEVRALLDSGGIPKVVLTPNGGSILTPTEEELHGLLSNELLAQMLKPGWEGNAPGLGYYLRKEAQRRGRLRTAHA